MIFKFSLQDINLTFAVCFILSGTKITGIKYKHGFLPKNSWKKCFKRMIKKT